MLNKFDKKQVPTLIYSRVVGYFSCVQTNWNQGKKAEFEDRKTYNPQKIESDIKKELTYV